MIARLAVPVRAGEKESVTVTVNEYGVEDAVVGVPVIAPVAVFRLKPDGREPDVTAQE